MGLVFKTKIFLLLPKNSEQPSAKMYPGFASRKRQRRDSSCRCCLLIPLFLTTVCLILVLYAQVRQLQAEQREEVHPMDDFKSWRPTRSGTRARKQWIKKVMTPPCSPDPDCFSPVDEWTVEEIDARTSSSNESDVSALSDDGEISSTEATNGSAEDREARELTAVEKQYFSEWIEPQLEKAITEARRKASFRGGADVYDNFAEEWIEKSMLKVNRLHLHPKFSERVKEYVRGFCEDGAWGTEIAVEDATAAAAKAQKSLNRLQRSERVFSFPKADSCPALYAPDREAVVDTRKTSSAP